MSHPTKSGWWLGHPSEKYDFVIIGMMTFPIFLGKFKIDGNQTTIQQKIVSGVPQHHPLTIRVINQAVTKDPKDFLREPWSFPGSAAKQIWPFRQRRGKT